VRELDPLFWPGNLAGPSQLIALVVAERRWRFEALVSAHDCQRLSLHSEATVIVRGRRANCREECVPLTSTRSSACRTYCWRKTTTDPSHLIQHDGKSELPPAESWFRVIVEIESYSRLPQRGMSGCVLWERAKVLRIVGQPERFRD